MSLLTTKTQHQQDIELLESLILQTAEAVNHLASTMAAANRTFWELPPDRIVAVLNADLGRTSEILAANSMLGAMVNAHLDKLGLDRFPARVPLTIGNPHIMSDGVAFVYEPPAETPQAAAESQPEPEQ